MAEGRGAEGVYVSSGWLWEAEKGCGRHICLNVLSFYCFEATVFNILSFKCFEATVFVSNEISHIKSKCKRNVNMFSSMN